MSICRRSFWKTLWFALRRSGKDKRARAAILSLALLLVGVVAEVGFLLVVSARAFGHGAFRIILNSVAVGAAFIASFLIRRSNRRQDESLNFTLTGSNPRQLPEVVSPQVRQYLEDRAVILASLLVRAASESCLSCNELPPGTEIVTRRVQNSLLRQLKLWEKLDPSEAAPATLSDGLWTAEQGMDVIAWCEHLRLLRWTLGIDTELIPLAHYPHLDYSLARELLERRAVQSIGPVRASWDLRDERDIAQMYFVRVVAELKGRFLLADAFDFGDWADEFRKESLGASVDFLVGPETVGDLSDERLRLLGLISHTRAQYTEYLACQLSGEDASPFPEWSLRNQT